MKGRVSPAGLSRTQSAVANLAGVWQRFQSSEICIFMRALCAWPQGIGSACPSSRYLARAMAREAAQVRDGLIVELGAGTGAVTRALLDQGIAPDRLVVIERSALLVAHLREKFPDIRIVEGDAAHLHQILDRLGFGPGHVGAVISSLPLRSLPAATVVRIGQALDRVLSAGTLFVQFTYSIGAEEVGWRYTAHCLRSCMVWRNIPPARVNSFAWGC